MKLAAEHRSGGLRRDLNDLVRGVDGKLSGSKIGTYAGQIIAAHILLANGAPNELPTWDVLGVLFLVLIAPEAYKQMLAMKWGGGAGAGFTERTERTSERTTTKTEK